MRAMDGIGALKRSLEKAEIIRIGQYHYFIHPISDGIPELEPDLLEKVANVAAGLIDPRCDRILTVEALGIPIATAISLRMRKPMTIVRKKRYGLPGEVSVQSSTGYATHTLYLNGVKRGEKVAFVDDVLSTGGTITAVARAVKLAGAKFCDAIVVIEKGGNRARVEKELGMNIKSLVKVEILDGKVVVR
jgi:adenine phosphoribosyltransferase